MKILDSFFISFSFQGETVWMALKEGRKSKWVVKERNGKNRNAKDRDRDGNERESFDDFRQSNKSTYV